MATLEVSVNAFGDHFVTVPPEYHNANMPAESQAWAAAHLPRGWRLQEGYCSGPSFPVESVDPATRKAHAERREGSRRQPAVVGPPIQRGDPFPAMKRKVGP